MRSSSPSTRSWTGRSPSRRSKRDTPTTREPLPLPDRGRDHRRLEHPGIVPVYGLGHDADGRPFYAMRFIRGETPQGGDRAGSTRATPIRGATPGERTSALRARSPGSSTSATRSSTPTARGHPPRPQAGQHHARPLRRDPRRRLGPGQGRRAGRATTPTPSDAKHCSAPASASGSERRCRARRSARRPS